MKIHKQDHAIFADLPSETLSQFPSVHVCPLESHESDLPKETIYVGEQLEPLQVLAQVTSKKLQNFVQKNDGRFEASLMASSRLIANRKDYFEKSFRFYSEDPESELHISFQGPPDKVRLKEQTLEFLEPFRNGTVATSADAITEELYMNAVIDAPREAEKQQIPITSRFSELYLCRTKNWLQISCSDPFGSLDVMKCLIRMNEVYQRGAGEAMNRTLPGGAGIGCVILFEQCCSLIFGVEPRKRTKVTCLIPIGISHRVRSEMKKSLQWFEL